MYLISHETTSPLAILDARRALLQEWRSNPERSFDRYANPFEQKWTWRYKFDFPKPVEALIRNMEDNLLDLALGLMPTDTSLTVDATRHYAGAFVYGPADYLNVHVDAGIHPTSGWKKAATALLYLDYGEPLEFWEGDNCTDEDPQLHALLTTVYPRAGTVVVFTNDDWAWHGVPVVGDSDTPRVLLTVSFLARDLPLESYSNMRERAFFVPRPGEEWSEKTYAVRDRRADSERYAEAYRAGVSE